MTPNEQLVRGIFVVFLVVAVGIVGALATRPNDGFPVGSCLRGHWNDIADSEVALVPCSESHDYVVAAEVDDWTGCPSATVGRMDIATGGLFSRHRYQCLVPA